MKELFVSYELALILKEKGFNEPCFGYWTLDTEEIRLFTKGFLGVNSDLIKSQALIAPLYQQVIDWFRNKYKLHLFIQQVWYSGYIKIGYFPLIYSNPETDELKSNERFGDVLEASSQEVPGKYVNDELFDKNIFEMGYAYKTYYEALNGAIEEALKLI